MFQRRHFTKRRIPHYGGGFHKRQTRKGWSNSELLRVVEDGNRNRQTVEEVTFTPNYSFSDFQVSDLLKANIIRRGYQAPMPIQDQAIPIILSGRDLIGIANTGTGKTAAFLIPLIDKVAKNRDERVLIVTPTRELASQIFDEFKSLSLSTGIYASLCIGGSNMYRQKISLSQNPRFVIGTPGRIKDMAKNRYLDLSKFNNVVLDETDRMVDIGFVNEIKFLVSLLPEKRQSLFFSATISNKVKEILQSFVREPITVSVKKQDIRGNVEQRVVKIEAGGKKVDRLHDVLIEKDVEKALIFGRTKRGVEKLFIELNKRGFKVGSIHGDKRQTQRQQILNKFKSNEIKVLLATDVASRGLDITGVSHVINYDLPESYEDYIHRIGRTGRVNKRGVALTFIEYPY